MFVFSARSYVVEGIDEIEELAKQGIKPDGILKDLMALKEIDLDEKIQIVADLILAAADTVRYILLMFRKLFFV